MEETRLAVLIDFENIAAGAEKEGLGRFDVEALMSRLKDKGRILVARSYADWGRFARFKQSLLTQNVTMMELTSHGMQDKNRADIAMVVDCLDLVFTKEYIETFVIVSGDSDFTPLVLKMRELDKRVIGCGTRGSTSRLLINACDEFIFYDNISKRRQQQKQKRRRRQSKSDGKGGSLDDPFDAMIEALEGLQRENPDPAFASVVKQAILRKHPDFNESDHGFSSFARFLEAAAKKGTIKLFRDRKSGGYRVDASDSNGESEADRSESSQAESRSRRRPEGGPLWTDEYLPEQALDLVRSLDSLGYHPLSAPARMNVLELMADIVETRKKRRRRVNVQTVTDDLRKRLKRTIPDLPDVLIGHMFDAMMRTGLLMHRDGNPIRRRSAPFHLEKTANQLNKTLTEFYLDLLGDNGADLNDAELLAELFLGDADRKREIEETLAWLEARNDDDVDGPTEEGADEDLEDLDSLLVPEDEDEDEDEDYDDEDDDDEDDDTDEEDIVDRHFDLDDALLVEE